MAEEYQQIDTPIQEDAPGFTPDTPVKLFVSNLVRRAFAFLYGWYKNKPKQLVADSSGRLRTSPGDYGWTFVDAGYSGPGSLFSGKGNTYKRLTLFGTFTGSAVWTVKFAGVNKSLYSSASTFAFVLYGPISEVSYAGGPGNISWLLEQRALEN